MVLLNKNILIVGMARSGISAAILCREQGAIVTLYDGKDKDGFKDKINELEAYDVQCVFGTFDMTYLRSCDLMILSPGVPCDLEFIIYAKQKGIQVIGEIELAYQFCQAPIIGITGTNGKTTTTSLVGEIARKFNNKTFVVGNIGNPFTSVLDKVTKNSLIVAEISSYQLETIDQFRPRVSAFLNLTEDHLDRHKTMSNYGLTKLSITKNQERADYCILNYDDKAIVDYKDQIIPKVIWFSTFEKVEGAYLNEGKLVYNKDNIEEEIVSVEDIQVPGKHNVENILAAIAISRAYGIPSNIIAEGIKEFKGVAHRIEFVKKINGTSYFNDSKATNPDAAIKGVEAMNKPTILIAGGMNKNSDYGEWIQSFGDTIKELILFGETREVIREIAHKNGYVHTHIVNNLKEAVGLAKTLSGDGENVLLSPACASWDMYKDFEVRGDMFKDIVNSL